MTRLPQQLDFENELSPMINGFFKTFRIAALLKSVGADKQSGIPAARIFRTLFSLAFVGRSLYMLLQTSQGATDAAKDTFYRFVNSAGINWFRFTTALAETIINTLIDKATGEDRVDVFIVDDTVYARGRSKKVELLSKVRDHSKKCFVSGYRLLTPGRSDGNTFMPVNGCLLASSSSESRYDNGEYEYDGDKRTCGYKQRVRALKKAPDAMIEMLKEAKKVGIRAKYVLFDSRFSSPKTVMAVLAEKLHVITMLKKTSKVHYCYNGEMLPITAIYSRNKKRPGRSKYLLSVEVGLNDKNNCKSIPARLVFFRNRNKKKEWLAIICTDMSLSEEEISRIYGKRWKIEVFFKVCKSYLRLTGECRSISFDAMTAYVAIVFARYMMLSAENRVQIDDRTLWELFYNACDELSDITLQESFNILLGLFIKTAMEKFLLTEDELESFVSDFMSVLPEALKSKMARCV